MYKYYNKVGYSTFVLKRSIETSLKIVQIKYRNFAFVQNSEILEKEDEHMLSGDASGGDSSEYEEYTGLY